MIPKRPRVLFISGMIIALGLLAALGYRYWYQPTYDFVTTDDASVTGSITHVAAPASGQINDLFVDVGSVVNKGDALATIKVVSTGAPAATSPTVLRVLARVTAPVSGTVAAKSVNVGDTVAAGQPIATIVDVSGLWVMVNVIETRVSEIKPGMNADVSISSVNQTFHGKVSEVGSATTEVTAPANPLAIGSSSDTDKKIPVKVTFDYAGYRLAPGMSANVVIYTRAQAK
jgi:multidrug resistance efflux pump